MQFHEIREPNMLFERNTRELNMLFDEIRGLLKYKLERK